MPIKRRLAPSFVLFVFLVASGACAASAEDCVKLGDKYVELFMSSQSEDSKKLGPEVLANAGEAGRQEIVEQCQAKSTPRASIQRCLAATTMDEFRKC